MYEVLILAKLNEIISKLDGKTKPVKDTMNLTEAAEYLNLSPSTLYKKTHKLEIAFLKPNGKKIYFRKEDLDNWLNRNRSSSEDEIIEEFTNNLINKKTKGN